MQLAHRQIPNHGLGAAEHPIHESAGADKNKALGVEQVLIWPETEGSAVSVIAGETGDA